MMWSTSSNQRSLLRLCNDVNIAPKYGLLGLMSCCRSRLRTACALILSNPGILAAVVDDSFGGGSVMMWAATSNDRKTDLVHVPGNLTAVRYINEILQPHLMHVIDQQSASFGMSSLLICCTNGLFHVCVTASKQLRNTAFWV
jgi:hypothetical protein